MDQFHDGHHVRLRSRVQGTYLHAADDGERVTLNERRASMNAAWMVHIYHHGDFDSDNEGDFDGDGEGDVDGDGAYLLLHSAAYGRYLAATATPARIAHHGFRAQLRDYDQPEVEAIMWRPVGSGFADDVVLLRSVSSRYLRDNGKHLPWNSGVSVEAGASTMMYWVVEPIPLREADIPDIPDPPPTRSRFLSTIFKRLGPARRTRVVEPILVGEAGMPAIAPGAPARPRYLSDIFMEPGRRIRFVRALQYGLYPEEVDHGWRVFWLRGRSVSRLRDELSRRLAVDLQNQNIAMCVRAGRYGRLTPLVVDLPHGGYDETLEIVVFLAGTPAYNELRYPDVDAA